jgi:ferredoxin
VVIISGKVAPKNELETEKLAKKKNPDLRLACQITVEDNLVIRTHV